MDSRIREDGGSAADRGNVADGGAEFVRFCYRRRRVGWPELYDEMCAVASRGIYRGWGFAELAEHGIGFGLSEMPRLAALASRVIHEETERRTRVLANVMAHVPTAEATELTDSMSGPLLAGATR